MLFLMRTCLPLPLHPNAGVQLCSKILLLPNDVLHEHGDAPNDDHMPNIPYIPMSKLAPQVE
jgi:hypothetical protein